MKKAIGIIVLGILICSDSFAGKQQELIDQYLSDRKLAPIEGVWSITDPNGVWVGVFRKMNEGVYTSHRIHSYGSICPNAPKLKVIQSSENFYTSSSFEVTKSCRVTRDRINVSYTISSNSGTASVTYRGNTWNLPMTRLWPNDLISHNAKFKTKEDVVEEEKVLAAMVNDVKKTCKVLGFEEGSEKFADCTLKLYTQKVDELVAQKVAANTRMMQSQTTTQQSSGSNTMTIYDPVRDNRQMINQGMKMLSGACTLGINC